MVDQTDTGTLEERLAVAEAQAESWSGAAHSARAEVVRLSKLVLSMEWCGERCGAPACPLCYVLEEVGKHDPRCEMVTLRADNVGSADGDILEQLRDLREQATRERSHFYVRSVVENAIAEIELLRRQSTGWRRRLTEDR